MSYVVASTGEKVEQLPENALLLLGLDGAELNKSQMHVSLIFVYFKNEAPVTDQNAFQTIVKHLRALSSYLVLDHVKSAIDSLNRLSNRLESVDIPIEHVIQEVRPNPPRI